MADSSRARTEQRTGILREATVRLSRYDLVLAAIPLLFALVLFAHVVFPISLEVAVGAGALTSSVLVADVLYVHPPTEPSVEP